MATTPFLMMATTRLRAEPVGKEERDGPVADGSNAIIVGYGRFGQTVGADADRPGHRRHPDRHRHRDDRRRRQLRRQGLLWRRHQARPAPPGRRGRGRADPVLHRRRPDRARARSKACTRPSPRPSIFVRAFDRRALLKLKDAPVAGVVREVLEFGGADGADGDGRASASTSRRSTGPRTSTAPATASG